jgi:hypothetical protein
MRIEGRRPGPQAKIPRKCRRRESLASGRKAFRFRVTKKWPHFWGHRTKEAKEGCKERRCKGLPRETGEAKCRC